MQLTLQQRKEAFIAAGIKIREVVNTQNPDTLSPACRELYYEIQESPNKNPWFTSDNVRHSLEGLCFMLQEPELNTWLEAYPDLEKARKNPLRVAVIMAGNLPMVGFHDFMCVMLAGHRFLGKLSGQDKDLPQKVAALVVEAQPLLNTMIKFTEEKIADFDAVIATGSNNTSRYFDYYFGRYPHIIRRNRNSIALLDGNEKDTDLDGLTKDIFMYFGLGCRNVSKILVPEGYNMVKLLDRFCKWEHLKDHSKYFNNYEYQKAILLVNMIPHYDTGFCIVRAETALSSPLAVVHFEEYSTLDKVKKTIMAQKENLQCVVAAFPLGIDLQGCVLPGETQSPGPQDYADGVDTMKFLLQL